MVAVPRVRQRTVRRLTAAEPGARVLALNFASARHPGGGFLQGSQAQEESLACTSGLYACIAPFREMYDANARWRSCLYTDHMIYSPDVSVFRDDADAVLEQPYLVSFVTARPSTSGHCGGTSRTNWARSSRSCWGGWRRSCRWRWSTVMRCWCWGAWGCGVFANDPERVAGWFHRHLTGAGMFCRAFRKVVFAVLDRTADRSTIRPFARYFGSAPGAADPGR